jgi:plastocyanin
MSGCNICKVRGKILYLVLPMILVFSIYDCQTSYEFSGYFKPNNVKKSNDVFTISIDKSSYKIGQTINISGKVNRFDEGTKVNFAITGPDNSNVSKFSSLVNRYGIFTSSYNIPDTSSIGNYTLSTYYDGDPNKKQISLGINISTNQNGIVNILIPQGASSQDNKLNFDPSVVNVTQGSKIVFTNNDGTVHTIISGKVNDDGSFLLNNFFRGDYITPGAHLVISPTPGKYNYFCKIHPWLGGSIIVKANPLAKTSLKSSIKTKSNSSSTANPKIKSSVTTLKNKSGKNIKTKSTTTSHMFPVSNTTLTIIWKSRLDLQKLYPEVAHGNLTNLIKWSTTTGWNQDSRLSALTPPGKVPDYVLTTIWKEQTSLQKLYPEVAHGNLTNLTKWAKTTGWQWDSRLTPYIPPGKIPTYLKSDLLTIWT